MIIFPSILEKTIEGLTSQIQKLSKYYAHFQIDITDGVFVNNKTVQIDDLFNYYTLHPNPYTLTFEFHLMVKDYEKDIKKLIELKKFMNIKTVLIHVSLSPDYSLLPTTYPLFSFGFVLNPEDSVKLLTTNYNLQTISLIQIMSVTPGAQGNPFIPESLQKIEQLRIANYRNKIAIDGAINDVTIPYILSQKFLPDILCPGSFLTRAENLEERVNYLKEKAL